MITLIDTSNGAACDTALSNMFAARKDVFVDLLGWDVPVLAGKFELDQFDDEHARYLILTDQNLSHLGSARLLPTTRPHILNRLFPELCAGPIPRGPGIWEVTRYCLSRGLAAPHRREIRNRLITALVAYARSNAIRTYTGVAELGWLRQVLAFGWDAAQLGPAQANDGTPLAAMRIDITSDTQAKLSANGIWLPTDAAPTPLEPAHAKGGSDARYCSSPRTRCHGPWSVAAPARGLVHITQSCPDDDHGCARSRSACGIRSDAVLHR